MFIDLVQAKQRIDSIKEKIQNTFPKEKVKSEEEKLKQLEESTLKPGFWESESMDEIMSKIKHIKNYIEEYNNLNNKCESIYLNLSLLSEESDESLEKDTIKRIDDIEKTVELSYAKTLLSGKYDESPSLVTIHAGAGGTESQDWAQMLFRMYQKWSDSMCFKLEVYDIIDGDEAGYKSITFKITGNAAYGYMKCEKGVHRLVRISPFDSNSRRHTSFASVDVMPEINDNIVIDIRPEDIEVQTYRASGAGGQHINKTDSAVRIKHIPTGIVVSCQGERSQIQNKETCMKMLRSKLFQYEQEKTIEKLKSIKGEVPENGWGSQIRSYVLCPYTLVKDHRTGFEVGNVQKVLDGDITEFIVEYLKFSINNNKD